MPYGLQPLSQRNIDITTQVLSGQTCRVVARDYHLSTTRVNQIVNETCRRQNAKLYWRLSEKRQYCQVLPALRKARHSFRHLEVRGMPWSAQPPSQRNVDIAFAVLAGHIDGVTARYQLSRVVVYRIVHRVCRFCNPGLYDRLARETTGQLLPLLRAHRYAFTLQGAAREDALA